MLDLGMRDWCFSAVFLERFREFLPQAEVHRLADAAIIWSKTHTSRLCR